MAAQDEISDGALAAISRELIRRKARQFANGGAETKVYLCENWLFCLCQGSTTTTQSAVLDQNFGAVVEELTGHPVLGYISQVMFDPDLAIEIFLLGGEP